MGDDHDGLPVNPERFSILNVESIKIGWATLMVSVARLCVTSCSVGRRGFTYSAMEAIRLR